MTFPTYLPTDRRYVHGEWPMKRHKFMANTEQRTLYATTKTGQELRLVYANQNTNVVETFMFHYNAMFGTQYAFDVPREALVGWDGGTAVMGLNQKWRYKQAPRITSQKGLLATLEVTLVTANVQDLVLENVGNTNNRNNRQSSRSAEPRSDADDCCGGGNGGVDSGFPIAPPQPSLPPTNPPPPINNPGDPVDPQPPCVVGCDPFFGVCSPEPCPLPTDPPGAPENGLLYQVQGFYKVMYTKANQTQCPECFNDSLPPAGTKFPDCTFSKPAIGLNSGRLFGYSVVDQVDGVNPGDITVRQTYSTQLVKCAYTDITGSFAKTISQAFYKGEEIDSAYGSAGETRNQYSCGRSYSQHTYHLLNQLIYRYSVPGVGTVELEVYRNPDYIDNPGYDGCDENDAESLLLRGEDERNSGTPPPPEEDPFDFPRVHPSTRTYSLSDWNSKRFAGGKSTQQLTLALPSAAVDSGSKLQLVFANRNDAVARAILDHYHQLNGSYKAFHLSDEVLADWNSVYRDRIRGAEWTYEAPPQVVSSHINTSTTSVRLVMTKSGRS